jgi:hypothetical protein
MPGSAVPDRVPIAVLHVPTRHQGRPNRALPRQRTLCRDRLAAYGQSHDTAENDTALTHPRIIAAARGVGVFKVGCTQYGGLTTIAEEVDRNRHLSSAAARRSIGANDCRTAESQNAYEMDGRGGIASGQAAADPTIPLMKSRRRIAFPRLRTTPTLRLQQGFATSGTGGNGQFAPQNA